MSRPHWDSLGRASGCSRPLATPLQLTLRLLPPVRMHVLSSSRACIRPPSHNRVVTAWPRSMCSCPPRSAPLRRLPPLSACSPSGLMESVWRRPLASAPAADRAELHSEAQPGARAFLAAVPQGACRMEPAVFLVELRRRLRIPDAVADVWCPRCDSVLDTHSRHASMCPAGGDRTRCHHTARNLVAAWAERAGLQPEVEKSDLLLPQRPDEVRLASRRPADVYLPAWDGSPTALDLAITGPTRSETLATACQEPRRPRRPMLRSRPPT